jgi:hypothetical protein
MARLVPIRSDLSGSDRANGREFVQGSMSAI